MLRFVTPNDTNTHTHTHTHTQHVRILWTKVRLVAGTTTRQRTTFTTDRHLSPRRDSNPQSKQTSTAELRLRHRGHGVGLEVEIKKEKNTISVLILNSYEYIKQVPK